MAIALTGIAARGRLAQVRDVRWASGQLIEVRGDSGSGKSTLLDIVTGFVLPTQGRVVVDGTRGRVEITPQRSELVVGRLARQVASIGVGRAFQQPERFDQLTTQSALALAKARVDDEQRRSAQALRESLDELLVVGNVDREKAMRELSYGQTRLVGFALACMVGSEAVVLDEPGAGIAAAVRPLLSRIIRGLAEEGRLVVVAEHADGVVIEPSSVLELER
jgi:branched-chain amino acid transport system ATP-binding protein